MYTISKFWFWLQIWMPMLRLNFWPLPQIAMHVSLKKCFTHLWYKYAKAQDKSVYNYSHAFLKKRRGYCNCHRPSVCPSRYLLLNHWTKSNQIWCVSCSHEWGVQQHIFFGPAPWGPGEGPKGQISLNFNYKVNYNDFLTKLCVSSHTWKI